MQEEFGDQEPRTEGRGRSAKKREAKAIEKLAERLVSFPENELSELPLDDALMADLVKARQTRGHGSRKRETKHFAGLLRRDEAAR